MKNWQLLEQLALRLARSQGKRVASMSRTCRPIPREKLQVFQEFKILCHVKFEGGLYGTSKIASSPTASFTMSDYLDV